MADLPAETADAVNLLIADPTQAAPSLPQSSLPPPVVVTGSRRSSSRGSRRSRRSRSSTGSRSRSRHRSASSHQHRCRSHFRHSERNFAAASCSMITIVILCTSLVPNWIHMNGGSCHLLQNAKGTLHTLSTRQFFYNGHFYKNFPMTVEGDTVYKFGDGVNDIMVNCVSYPGVLLFKASIAFTLIAVIFSFAAFLLDLFGPTYQLLKMLRRNAIFNILTVVMCVTVNLFAYCITTSVNRLQMSSRLHVGSAVIVTFDASFYLITAAGGLSVVATACNCLRRPMVPTAEHTRFRDSYYDDTEALLAPMANEEGSLHPAVMNSFPPPPMPPPPPYTP